MGKWHPNLSPKQLDMYESPARTKVATGPRYCGKTWVLQNVVLQHCWRHEARFVIVPKTNRVAEAGGWTSLINTTYPEWVSAGICSDKAEFGWIRPPYTNALTKVMTAELWNRHGTKSVIQVMPIQYVQEAKDKLFSTEYSGFWLSEAHLWPSDDVYKELCNQLRLPGVKYEDQLVLLDANPPESGRRHWIYTGFIDPPPFPEDLPKEDRQHAEYERGLTKIWHFYQEDNPNGDPNVMRGYNTRYARSPLEYRRFVRGEWLDGTEEDLCFKSVWDQNTMTVGNADSIREEDWQVLCPSNGLHVNRRGGKVCLVDGWDAGAVNHAWVGLQPWTNKDGKLCFDVLDEHVVVNQKMSVKTFADEAHKKIQLLEQLADVQPVDPLLDDLHIVQERGPLQEDAGMIRDFFSAETLLSIFETLRGAKGAAKNWADRTLADLQKRSPLSLAITFRHIRDCRQLDLRETLIQDYRLAWRCLDASDFAEGVRAALIDKDHSPRWTPARLEDVDGGMVDRYFAPLGADDLLLATREEMQAARV